MSIHLLKLLLSELQTVRVVCRRSINDAKGKECGGVAEVPLAKLGMVGKCPVCHHDFEASDDAFGRFARATESLLQAKNCTIEFVVLEK